MEDIKRHRNETLNTTNEASIGKDQVPPAICLDEPQSKHRRMSQHLNDDEISTADIELEHTVHSIDSDNIVQKSKHHQSLKSKIKCHENKTSNKEARVSIDKDHVRNRVLHQTEVKQHKYESEDVGNENEIKVECGEQSHRILLKEYYKVIGNTEHAVTAVCRNCKLIQDCYEESFFTFRRHLEVSDFRYDF